MQAPVKRALLNSVARNLEKAYIPFTVFKCKRDDAERSDVQRILPTICYDLTRFFGDYRGAISELVKRPEGRSITTGDVATQMELLFGKSPSYKMICRAGGHRPPVHVILIDALDECKDVRERSVLAGRMRDLANDVPWIKVIITSRPESDIADVLGDMTHPIRRININDEKWDTSTDIHRFIEARSETLKLDLSSIQVKHFQERASGLFVWCTTAFKYIEQSKRAKSDVINEILGSSLPRAEMRDNPFDSLYALYQRVLDSAVSLPGEKSNMELILGIIYVASSRQPLSSDAIADILYPDEHEDMKTFVKNIIESLSAIVYVAEGTSSVRTCHPSVLDFVAKLLTRDTTMDKSPLKTFSITTEGIHGRVFKGCFAVMNHRLRFNLCELENSFLMNSDVPDLPARIERNISEALRYGILFWMSHLEQSESKESAGQILAFLNSHMVLFWFESLSLLDVIDRGIVALQDCSQFFTVCPSCAKIH